MKIFKILFNIHFLVFFDHEMEIIIKNYYFHLLQDFERLHVNSVHQLLIQWPSLSKKIIKFTKILDKRNEA